jgi:histidinol-phosphatase (PHP family)
MKIFDYQLHSKNSFDGKDELIDICQNAVKLGIHEICITEHFSINPHDPSYEVFDYEKYSRDIDFCKAQLGDRLVIKRGKELGEPHVNNYEVEDFLQGKDFDFLIGSIHNIGDLKLRAYIKDKTKHMGYRDYFEEVYKTVKYSDIDVLGHLDLMKRYALNTHGNYDFKDYEDIITQILVEAINRGIGIEVNTSGLRTSLNEAFPKIEVLKLYKELGGEILTIGSDSHNRNDVGHDFNAVVKMLMEIGFKYIYTYDKRKPSGVLLEQIDRI